MKHDSKKHVVPVWTICKGRKFVHLPLSPPIEMSKKHLGLLFSDIFPAKCVQERENSHCTRGRTRGCLLPRDTQEDTADQTTDCQTKWQLLDDRISKTIISRGVSQYSHFITETNVQQSEDSDFYRGICSFYPWSVISRCGLSKTTPRGVP